MNERLSEILRDMESAPSSDLAATLALLLENSFYTWRRKPDHDLPDPEVKDIKLKKEEIRAVENVLERVILNDATPEDPRGAAIWALGKCHTTESLRILLKILSSSVADPNTGYQLAIALENLWEEHRQSLSKPEIFAAIKNLRHFGLLESRVKEVTDRIISESQ